MRVSYEGARGCGHRQAGGIYLVSDGVGQECDLLPVPLTVCPTCGSGVKPARGWTWVDPDALLPHHNDEDLTPLDDAFERASDYSGCPLNWPGLLGERAGLLWIGEKFYRAPQEWISEGRTMGFSRRIASVPNGFEIGKTWVLAAHRKAISHHQTADDRLETTFTPAIFHIWKPARIEYVVRGDETDEEIAALEKRGLEPVRVVPLQQEMTF